jgi:SOS-response transcriptional repressor LexA
MDAIGARLQKARTHAGFETAREAARSLGVNVQTYASHENGHGNVRADAAVKYARKFKVNLEWLLTGRGEMIHAGVVPADIEQRGLPIVGDIRAGAWLDTTLLEPSSEETLPVARDERWPRARQYALRVLGNSMDQLFPEGCYVTCVDFADSGMELRDKMIVHVERQMQGGQLIEITLKAVEIKNGKIALVPRSSDPKWQPYILSKSADGAEVVVRGVVTGKYERQEF